MLRAAHSGRRRRNPGIGPDRATADGEGREKPDVERGQADAREGLAGFDRCPPDAADLAAPPRPARSIGQGRTERSAARAPAL